MGNKSSIEWTDATWTPIRARSIELQRDGSGRERIGWHCEHVSEGCRHCYAERRNVWIGTGRPFKPAERVHVTTRGDTRGSVKLFVDDKLLAQPQRWRAPRDIFVCSMTDLFAEFVPDEWIDQLFAVMCEAPWHRYQVLTKRARRMRAYMTTPGRQASIHSTAHELAERGVIRLLGEAEAAWPLPHVTLMVSAETQREADERVPELLSTPAACRGVSLEPLLAPVDLRRIVLHSGGVDLAADAPPEWQGVKTVNIVVDALRGSRQLGIAPLDWVIVGGESGPGARPMHPQWVRALRDQCAEAGVAFHFKQWGELAPRECVEDTRNDPPRQLHYERAHDMSYCRMGKKAAGRQLDGVQHNGAPARCATPRDQPPRGLPQ